jgi:hypothetical protein
VEAKWGAQKKTNLNMGLVVSFLADEISGKQSTGDKLHPSDVMVARTLWTDFTLRARKYRLRGLGSPIPLYSAPAFHNACALRESPRLCRETSGWLPVIQRRFKEEDGPAVRSQRQKLQTAGPCSFSGYSLSKALQSRRWLTGRRRTITELADFCCFSGWKKSTSNDQLIFSCGSSGYPKVLGGDRTSHQGRNPDFARDRPETNRRYDTWNHNHEQSISVF